MRLLVACEFSGTIRDAFAACGWSAMSCDLLPTEAPGEHHTGDIFDFLDRLESNDALPDLLIGNPPCTDLSCAGANLWATKAMDGRQQAAAAFVHKLATRYAIPHIAIENPTGWLNTNWRKPDQIINPYYFCDEGDHEYVRKRTCLWLTNLPALVYSAGKLPPQPKYFLKTGPKAGSAVHFTAAAHGWKERAKTFKCVAQAMAKQWTQYLFNCTCGCGLRGAQW